MARVPHGSYRPSEAFTVFQVAIDRALLSLIGILRPATPPFRELIVAEPMPFPPGAGHFAVG